MVYFEVCMLGMLEIFSSSETTWQLHLEGNSYSKSSLTLWGAVHCDRMHSIKVLSLILLRKLSVIRIEDCEMH